MRLDVDANLGVPSRYGVLSLPTVIVFVGGEPVETILGAQPRRRYAESRSLRRSSAAALSADRARPGTPCSRPRRSPTAARSPRDGTPRSSRFPASSTRSVAERLAVPRGDGPLRAPGRDLGGRRRGARASSSPPGRRRASRSRSRCRSSTRSRATRPRGRSSSTRRRRSRRIRRAGSRASGCRASGPRSTTATRRSSGASHIRRTANVILTNPDMLHVGVLPHHDRWGDVLHNLRLVVVDEAHVYRGIFGSHVGNVLRRLRRLALAYGADPVFVLASATIANAGELATRLTGLDVPVVADDTAPQAEREVVLWNPELLDPELGTRASALGDASRLLAGLVGRGLRTICFTKSRKAAELVHRFASDRLDPATAARLAPVPRRLHARAAPRDRAAARRGRAARGHGDRRARARDRHRLARLRDLGRLPRHRRLAPPAVGTRRSPDAAGSRSSSRARTRSTSSSCRSPRRCSGAPRRPR